MYARLLPLVVCLCLALAMPAWGGGTTSGKTNAPQQKAVTAAPAVIISPSGYKRDPGKVIEMKLYNKSMLQKQKQAAANRAAAKAGQPKATMTEGGTK